MGTTAVEVIRFDFAHESIQTRPALRRYVVAAAVVAGAFLIRYLLSPVLGDELPFMFSLAAILFAAWYGGWGPGVGALLLGVLLGGYFMFLGPTAAKVSGPVDELRIVRYLLTAGLGIMVIEALHRSKRQLHHAAEQVSRHARQLEFEVAERKRSEAELEQARDQLSNYASQLERRVGERTGELRQTIEALEGVLYHIAHNLRAPLRAMEGFTTILLKEYAPQLDPRAADYAVRVSEAAVRMDQLLHGLLEYGRLGHAATQSRPLELEEVLGSTLDRLSETIKASKAAIFIERPLPPVCADRQILELVLLHVIKNAIIFVQPWTTPQIRIWSEKRDWRVRLWIEDNGIGIEPEYHARIFWVFERLRPTYPGIGIGLAIVAKGMQRMHGQVGLESTPHGGSKFWLELPEGEAADKQTSTQVRHESRPF